MTAGHVRPAAAADREAWLRLRAALWPDGSVAEHARETAAFLDGRAREPLAVLLAIDAGGRAVGLAELSIRPCAEGCRTDRVAYLEGWYVEPDARRRGVGRALITAAENWARAQGCTEFASDAHAANRVSAEAHRAVGFEEAGLIRCFRKALGVVRT